MCRVLFISWLITASVGVYLVLSDPAFNSCLCVAFVVQSAALLTNICNTSNSSRPFCGYGQWFLLAIKLHYGWQSL
ncbi:hypothetical protein ACLKA6_018754 [Drosophila palustris]